MSTEALAKPDNALSVVVNKSLSFEVGKAIIERFTPFYDDATKIVSESKSIVVTDATQVTEIRQARAARLALKDVRVATDKSRVAAKEESLKRSTAIDDAARVVRDLCEAEETRLKAMEEFAERKEAERKAKLRDDRAAALGEFGPVDAAIVPSLGEFAPAAFDAMINGAKLARDARIAEAKAQEEARRVEEERRAQELKEAREKQAQAEAEAAKARKEREESEAKARAEREAADAKAKREREAAEEVARKERLRLQAIADAERQKREAAEKVERERVAAEKKRLADEALAAKKAAAAPDADKLLALAESFRQIVMPRASTSEGQSAIDSLLLKRESFVGEIIRAAERLRGGA